MMPTAHPPPLLVPDYVGPVVAAAGFVVLMSFVRESVRRPLNALIVAGASGAYLSGGGFGVWEILYPVLAMPFAYAGLRSYRFIAIAWFMHAGWDFLHHMWGGPIWPFMPTSSFGCLVFDALIAIWFVAGAPSFRSVNRPTSSSSATASAPN
jgi:Family of unknown function (DUF6010)